MAFGQTAPRLEAAQTLSSAVLSADLLDRFWAKVNKNGPISSKELGNCHVWTAGINNYGYGVFSIGHKCQLSHRVAYYIEYGVLPIKRVVHKCNNRLCVRLDHLYDGFPEKTPVDPSAWIVRFWSKVNKNGPIHPKLGTSCWLWQGCVDGFGYGLPRVNDKIWRAHRLSWVLSRGEISKTGLRALPDNKLYILHKCDVPACCRPSHLFEGTSLDNVIDRDRKGRHVVLYGSEHGSALLTEASVLDIRSRYKLGETDRHALANEYDVSYCCISDILNRRSWRHI